MNKILAAIIVFLIIGAYLITTRADYDLKDNKQERTSFLKDFSGWVVNLGKNMVEITGLVGKQDWLPQEYNDTDYVK